MIMWKTAKLVNMVVALVAAAFYSWKKSNWKDGKEIILIALSSTMVQLRFLICGEIYGFCVHKCIFLPDFFLKESEIYEWI